MENDKIKILEQKYPSKLLVINSLTEIPSKEYLVYILFYENEPIVLGHGKKNRASVIFDSINKITSSHIKALFVRLYVLFGSGSLKRYIIICNDKNEAKNIERELHKLIGGNNRHIPEFIFSNLFSGINEDSIESLILKIALNSSFSGIDDLKKWKREGILSEEVWSIISRKLKL